MVGVERAPFIGIDKCEHCLDFRSASHAGFLFAPFKRFRDFVVPAPLTHEFIPNVNLIFGRVPSGAETPLQDFVIRTALLHAFDQLIVIHPQEPGAAPIETFAEVRLIIRRQFAFGMTPNFIQHPTEINQAAHFSRGTAEAKISHESVILRSFLIFSSAHALQ